MIKGISFAVMLLLCFSIVLFLSLKDPGLFKIDAFLSLLGELAALNPFVFVTIYFCSTVLLVPGSALTLLGGAAFGTVHGALLSLLGATLGAAASFLLSRYFFRNLVAKKFPKQMEIVNSGISRSGGFRYLVFIRLVPLFPFNVVNYVFGVTNMVTTQFVLVTLLSMIPGAALYAYLGDMGMQVAGGASELRAQFTLACCVAALLLFLPGLIKKMIRKA